MDHCIRITKDGISGRVNEIKLFATYRKEYIGMVEAVNLRLRHWYRNNFIVINLSCSNKHEGVSEFTICVRMQVLNHPLGKR